jgi:GNAT superfamily N-acetyltransferase
MKPKEIIIDNTLTIIQPMGYDYIIGEDPDKAGIKYEIRCWHGKPVAGSWPNPPVVSYYKKLIDNYGTGAIMAWQDKSLIGFLPFYPQNCGLSKVNCVCAPIDTTIEKINSTNLVPLDNLCLKTLEVQCLSVTRRLHRKGLGTAMSIYLIEWAKEQGWDKIQGWAFSDSHFIDAYKWLPSIHFWEKSGFQKEKSREMDIEGLGSNIHINDFSISF